MASGQRSLLSSVFDAMLAHNRERLDALLGEERTDQTSDVAGGPAAARPPGAPTPLEAGGSAAAQLLNERFANRWRYEIVERHRVGEEAIVLCKLFVEGDGIVRTQFGRAAIAATGVAGRSGTVRFRLELGTAEHSEDDAYRRATENALANCVKLL